MVPSGSVGGDHTEGVAGVGERPPSYARAFDRFVALLDTVEDYYTTGKRRPAQARTRLALAPSISADVSSSESQAVETPNSRAAASAQARLEPSAPQATLAEVVTEVSACQLCGLCQTRTNTVPGEGVLQPQVLVIGEGPGRDEDLSGRPFVGAAGKYLDRWLAAIKIDRSRNAYIANVVKCRPPNNRDPTPDESAACMPYLRRQIEALRPRAILSVGRVASQLLTGSTIGIGAMRGQVYSFQPVDGEAIPLVVTYHPSGVLRNPSLREPVWDDLRTLRQIIP